MSYADGNIPDKIIYVYSTLEEVDIGGEWDSKSKIDVCPTFIVDASNKNTMKTAETWANKRVRYNNIKTHIGLTKEERDNSPIKNIKLIRLDHRAEGGRAYKVLIDGKFYVDLREDVLLDILLKEKVDEGIFGGEYIWARHGSQMKLVRVGSALHALLVKSTNMDKMSKIPNSDFKVGGIYTTKRGDKAIFIGYVSTTRVSYDRKTKTETFKKIRKGMLFYEFMYGEEIPDKFTMKTNRWRKVVDRTPSSLVVRTSHVFKEKIGEIPISFDVIQWSRSGCRKIIKEKIANMNKEESRTNLSNVYYNFEIISELANMYEFGTTPIEIFDIKKFLVFL